MSSLKQSLRLLANAEDAVVAKLKDLYPEGTEIRVYIMHGQMNPTVGTVIGHDGGRYGQVRVRLHTRKEDVRSVGIAHIVGRA